MGRLLTLGHFHGITALLAKVGQQPLQPLGGEIVAPGMGNHRLAARMMNHINRLFYCTPLRRHVTGFPAGKVFLKTSAMFFAWPASTRKRAKWPRVTAPPSASRSAPSRGAGDPRLLRGARQSSDRAAGAALSAPPAGRSSLGAQYQYSDPQYESRDSPKGWKSRRRSPRVKGNPARAISSRAAGIAATLSWSVIAGGADAHLMGAMDQFLRSQPPVRGGGMAVQIVNHCVLAVAQKDSCWTST